MNQSQVIESAVKPLTQGEVVATPIEKMSPADLVLAFRVLDFIEKQVKTRKAALRDALLGYADTFGVEDKKGSKHAQLDGSKITKEKRISTDPNADGLKTLLTAAQLGLSEAFDEVKTLQVNPSKVAFLVETGKLKDSEVAALHAVTWALKVAESKALKETFASAKAPKLAGSDAEDE
jgi:hypothetical protein